MRFGMSQQEADEAPRPSSGGGTFIKYPKEGGNQVRILDEPDAWLYFFEHFNPGGYSFPCTRDVKTCPGCTSDNEKMKKASEKVAMNCYDGQYTNVWKFPRKSVADKLKARWERIGTITDRDYLITQIKSKNGVEYDLEGLDKEPFNFSEVEEYKRDPEELLAEAYDEAWGSDAKSRTSVAAEAVQQQLDSDGEQVQPKKRAAKKAAAPEPKPETQVTEKELREMDFWGLVKLCKDEGFPEIPRDKDTVDQIVDWMLEQD